MNTTNNNTTPHFLKKCILTIPRKSRFVNQQEMGNSPLPRGFFCARAKGVRGMYFNKLNEKKSLCVLRALARNTLNKWGAWGANTNPQNNTTTIQTTNYVYCTQQCNTPFFAKHLLSNGRNSPLPRGFFLSAREGG